MAGRRLEEADDLTNKHHFAVPIARANAWFRAAHPAATLDRAALLLALPQDAARRIALIAAIEAAQNLDGGWGPFPRSPSEPFDTAVVLLALPRSDAFRRGRAWLVKSQLPDGD